MLITQQTIKAGLDQPYCTEETGRKEDIVKLHPGDISASPLPHIATHTNLCCVGEGRPNFLSSLHLIVDDKQRDGKQESYYENEVVRLMDNTGIKKWEERAIHRFKTPC